MNSNLIKSKINLFDKIIWRIKYAELSSMITANSPLKIGILKNKIIAEQYNKSKREIMQVLKRMKQEAPNKLDESEEIITQTLYQDYMNEKFPNSEHGLDTTNISDVINNLEFMLDIKEMGKTGNIIYEHLDINDCKNKYIKQKISPMLKYSETILKKVPFDILEHISFISEQDFHQLNMDDVAGIINAVKNGVDNSQVGNYLKLCKNQKFKNSLIYFRTYDFLRANMECSDFFVKYSEKYGELPTEDLIYELFEDTKNLDAKEIMLNLGMDKKTYEEIRSKYFDYKIQVNSNEGLIDTVKILISRKYFNVTTEDIDGIKGGDKYFSESTQKIINYIKKIQDIGDINTLNRLNREIGQMNLEIDTGEVFDEIYEFYAKEKIEGCFDPNKFIGERQSVEYNGKKVEILKLNGEDFRGNIHVLGHRNPGNKNLTRTEVENKMNENPLTFAMLQGGSSQLSLSAERDDAMAFYGLTSDAILLGYSDIEPQNVLLYSESDGATSIWQTNYNKEIQNVKSKVNFNNKTRYDEVLATRYKDPNKIKQFRNDSEERILPSYILVFTKGKNNDKPSINYQNLNDPNTKRIFEYATTYNIPIVEMNTEKYMKKYESKYTEMFAKLKSGRDKFEIEDYKALARYRRSIDFYKSGNYIMSDQEILWKIANDIDINPQNKDAIKGIIKEFDREDKKWENTLKYRSDLSDDKLKQAEEKMRYFREVLDIKEDKVIEQKNEVDYE